MYLKIKQLVKGNNCIYKIYCYSMSFILKFISFFINTDENLILYVVYGGQRYDDSPRFVYEYLKNSSIKQYSKYKHVWAFINPDEIDSEYINQDEKVRIDSFKYFYVAMKAKYWITNSSAARGLYFKKKKTINVLFQHGMAGIKLLGKDIHNNDNKSFGKGFSEKFDYIVIEGKLEEKILRRAWDINTATILNIGLPRNDELSSADNEDIQKIKEKLKIPRDKIVILYAPTFREYSRSSSLSVYLRPPFDFDKWNNVLGDKYVLLLTAHYEVAKLMDVPDNHPFVINAFKYPYINDLMLASDILISDYSSIIFDYSILCKPIISYAYDYDTYSLERGVYEGYESLFSNGIMKTEDEIIDFLNKMTDECYIKESEFVRKNIRDRYLTNWCNSTQIAVKTIFGD